jgi:GTPase
LIIHVIDVTHPYYEDHIRVVEETLKNLGVSDTAQVKVFNKIDALENRSRSAI